MKNLGISIWSIFFIVVLLTACSSPEPMSSEEVQQHFQSIFDSGQRENATDEQIKDELEQLKAIAEDNRSFPSDYEEQYRTWRVEQVQAIREMATKALQKAYTEIINSYPLYNGLSAGLIYADYLDMNQDGIQELLLLSAPNGEITENSIITIQLYTGIDGQANLSSEMKMELYAGRSKSKISLYQKNDSLYLCTYIQDDASSSPTYIQYYKYDGKSLVLVDDLFSWYDWVPDEERKDTFYSPENFNEIIAQYTLLSDLFTFNYNSGASFVSRGILPEPDLSSDIQRRITFLDILNHTDNLMYAKLVDINQDEQEDLLTFYKRYQDLAGITLYYFRCYVWDEQQVQEIDLSSVGNEEIDSYLSMGFGSYGLYQQTDNGQLYACYDGEIVGGWGGTLFVNLLDPTDYEFCGYPFIGSDYSPEFYTPEEAAKLEAEYAKEEKAYTAFIERYQLIDDVYDMWENPETESTIQMVIQELENG